jgi:hypothetical protein
MVAAVKTRLSPAKIKDLQQPKKGDSKSDKPDKVPNDNSNSTRNVTNSDKPDADFKKGLQANAHSPSFSAPVLSAYLGLGKFN